MKQKNVYEIGLLINPDLSQQEAEKTVENIKNILEKESASVISKGEVVDIDLAYQIITKIASKNERFDKAYFSWIKFDSETDAILKIKKEIDKNKAEIFRYLITKTVSDDESTDKYQKISDEIEIDLEKKSVEETGYAIDTTSEKEISEEKKEN